MNSKKKVFKNSIIYFIGNFATKILAFFMLPLYTRYLNPEDYGNFDTLQSYTTLLVPIIFIQISDAVIRMLLDAKDTENRTKYVSNAFFTLFLGTLVSIVVIPLVSKTFVCDSVFLFILYFALYAWQVVIQQMVRSLGYTKLYAMGGIVSTCTTVGLNLIFIVGLGLKSTALVLSAIGTSLFICLFMFFSAKLYRFVSIKAISRSVMVEMAKYCVPLIPNTVSWHIITTFSKLYLGYVCGQNVQGLFSVANRFPALITMLTGIFYLAWQEIGIVVYNTSERDGTYTEIFNFYFQSLFAGTIVLLPLSKIYILYTLAEDYKSIWIYVPIMVAASVFSALNSFLGTAYLGNKSTKNVMYTSLMAAVINVLILILLTKSMGIWGVAIAGLIAYLFLFAIRLFDVRKYVQIKISWLICLKSILGLALVTLLFYLLDGVMANICTLFISFIVAAFIMFDMIKNVFEVLKNKFFSKRGE